MFCLILQLMVLLVSLNKGQGQLRQEAESLYTTLLPTSYMKNVRPESDQSVATSVKMSIQCLSIRELDETSGLFSITAFMSMRWTEGRFTWTPASYGNIAKIEFSQDDVWKPDVTLANPFSSLQKLGTSRTLIKYTYDGVANWTIGDVFDTTCDINVERYPFDTQECYLYFLVWGYYLDELTLQPIAAEVDFDFYTQSSEWEITKTSSNQIEGVDNPYMRYSFSLRRRSMYFVVNVFIPVILLTLLGTMVFCLPADSGERVGYSITCLLSISVFLTIVSDNLPRSSKPTSILGSFLMCDFALCSTLCILTIISLRIYHKDEDEEVPNWMKRAVTVLHRCKCKCCNRRQSITSGSDKNTTTDVEVMSIADSNETINSSIENETLKEENDPDDETITWKTVGHCFDLCCFVISNVSIIFMFSVYVFYTNV